MSNELKPCPFCGGKAKVTRENQHPPLDAPKEARVITQIQKIECAICGSSGADYNLGGENNMVAVWNTRVLAPVPTSGAEEVAEAHKQIYAAVQTTLANCLPSMKEPIRQAAAVSLALKLREMFAKGVA